MKPNSRAHETKAPTAKNNKEDTAQYLTGSELNNEISKTLERKSHTQSLWF
jgi:hypothetical protein